MVSVGSNREGHRVIADATGNALEAGRQVLVELHVPSLIQQRGVERTQIVMCECLLKGTRRRSMVESIRALCRLGCMHAGSILGLLCWGVAGVLVVNRAMQGYWLQLYLRGRHVPASTATTTQLPPQPPHDRRHWCHGTR
jgi:hypothetical protein